MNWQPELNWPLFMYSSISSPNLSDLYVEAQRKYTGNYPCQVSITKQHFYNLYSLKVLKIWAICTAEIWILRWVQWKGFHASTLSPSALWYNIRIYETQFRWNTQNVSDTRVHCYVLILHTELFDQLGAPSVGKQELTTETINQSQATPPSLSYHHTSVWDSILYP